MYVSLWTVYGFIFHVDKMRAIATAYIVKINELNKHNWNCVGSFAYICRTLVEQVMRARMRKIKVFKVVHEKIASVFVALLFRRFRFFLSRSLCVSCAFSFFYCCCFSTVSHFPPPPRVISIRWRCSVCRAHSSLLM